MISTDRFSSLHVDGTKAARVASRPGIRTAEAWGGTRQACGGAGYRFKENVQNVTTMSAVNVHFGDIVGGVRTRIPPDVERAEVEALVEELGRLAASDRLGLDRRTLYRVMDRRPVFPSTLRRIRERLGGGR